MLKYKEYLIIKAFKKKLLLEIRNLILLFNKREADKLLPYKDSINYYIEIRE